MATPSKWSKADAEHVVDRVEALLRLNLIQANSPGVLVQALVTQLAIDLRDLLKHASAGGLDTSFRDGIPAEPDADNLAMHINTFRNAACHIDSGNRSHKTATLHWSVLWGEHRDAIMFMDRPLNNEFADDVAFIYGVRRLLFRRHLLAGLALAKRHYNITTGIDAWVEARLP